MIETKGPEGLRREMRARGWTQATLGEQLGLDQSAVSRWCAGASRPEAHHRTALARLLGVPELDWLTAAELAVIERAEGAAQHRA